MKSIILCSYNNSKLSFSIRNDMQSMVHIILLTASLKMIGNQYKEITKERIEQPEMNIIRVNHEHV
jgi:hypothetical protein